MTQENTLYENRTSPQLVCSVKNHWVRIFEEKQAFPVRTLIYNGKTKRMNPKVEQMYFYNGRRIKNNRRSLSIYNTLNQKAHNHDFRVTNACKAVLSAGEAILNFIATKGPDREEP